MKRRNLLFGFTVLFLVALIFVSAKEEPVNTKMPDEVKVIIDKSCYGCHNTASKNERAKKDLDFKKIDKLSKIRKIGAYKQIMETVEEGKMPPKKFLSKYPDKNLTEDEKKILINWAKKEAETLVKN